LPYNYARSCTPSFLIRRPSHLRIAQTQPFGETPHLAPRLPLLGMQLFVSQPSAAPEHPFQVRRTPVTSRKFYVSDLRLAP